MRSLLCALDLVDSLTARPYHKVPTMSFILSKASVPLVLYLAVFSYAQTCFTPNGKAVDRTFWGSLPCNTTAAHSMCCKLDRSVDANIDTCLPNGLCAPADNSRPFRGPCTDPTWKDPACIQLCTQALNQFGQPYNTTVGIPLTYCADGSFCCGTNWSIPSTKDGSKDCCKQKDGLYLMNREAKTAIPSTSAARAAATAATTATITATSSPASLTVSKPTNTGAIVGGAVGGIAAVAILSLALWYSVIRRNVKQTAQPSFHAQAPYDMSEQQIWHEPNEVPENVFRGELDTAAGMMTTELDTRQNR
ncbi:hypothetical protein N7G274_009607 [Stereocaulon virgatum]|uniref:Uncharacterized protein n=1 Tax=Stereocaulon virgatum TaxID=373712 RepID=A0ABR3ZVP2_9LECA